MDLTFQPPENEYLKSQWVVEKLRRAILDLRYIRPDVAKSLESDLFAAVDIYRQERARREARRPSPERIAELRREISNNYNYFFDTLVDRDGAHCNICRYTKTLAIDHIEPVVFGGTNDLNNLQLLCKSCNSKKGSKVDEVMRIIADAENNPLPSSPTPKR